MSQHTPLYQQHVDAGGKMVDFAGWSMPINYGSQIEEHHQLRSDAGLFDVSHMTVVDFRGAGVKAFLSRLLANDVAKLTVSGKALYSCMLNNDGGVIDDLIVYFMDDNWFRMVVNAATRDKDLAWMREQMSGFELEMSERADVAMLAVQGPKARAKAAPLCPDADAALALKPFNASDQGEWFVARTGYTGEDGFEIICPASEAAALWDGLLAAGVKPAGLGARDTLRLEAGMNLYGQDMDESINPLEAGLSWTVSITDERDFIGKSALQAALAAGNIPQFAGLILKDRGVLRAGQTVITDKGEGIITSGTFSPTMQQSIAMARLPAGCGSDVTVEVRNKQLSASIVSLPFVRNGKVLSN